MKFHIKTFGCRVNLAESEELAIKLRKLIKPSAADAADIIIVRACSVTMGAEQGVRQAIRNYARQGKKIFVLGCFLEKLPQAKYFKSDAQLVKFLKNNFGNPRSSHSLPPNGYDSGRARVFIKIQSGCDFNCAFCVTKNIRGKSKNASEEKILKQIKDAEKRGTKEIILTGTNILLYKNIAGLVKKILKETGISRIRFGSVDPRLIAPSFIKLFRNPRLMPHLHFSIQSGSEKILTAMRRPVKIKKIEEIAKTLRNIDPLFNISADMIVGFPGETDADFQRTVSLAEKLNLSKIHFFPYSPRPNTAAVKIAPVKSSVIRHRLLEIKKLDCKLQNEAKKRIRGKKLTVLFEYAKNRVYYGYAPNFTRIAYPSKNNLTGKNKKIIIK